MTKSIISMDYECVVCGRTTNLHRHHIFFGTANRDISEQQGCWCYLCPRHHNTSGYGVHYNQKLNLMLRRRAQKAWMEKQSRTSSRFLGGTTLNSHAKGKRFELEIAAKLREMGYEARRTQQYSGKTEEASDVVGLPGIHIECKHQEQMRLYEWMAQAERDAKDTLPAVFHKQNRKPILVTMKFEDWMKLYKEYEVHCK